MTGQKIAFLMVIFLFGCTSQVQSGYRSYEEATDLEIIQGMSKWETGLPDPFIHGQYPSLTQTISGVTVSIDWTYSDGESVFIGYHYQGLKTQRYFAPEITITEEGGVNLKQIKGFGVTEHDDIQKIVLPSGYGAGYVVYKLAESLNSENDVILQISLVLEQMPSKKPNPTPINVMDFYQYLFKNDHRKSEVERVEDDPNRKIGPFHFDPLTILGSY